MIDVAGCAQVFPDGVGQTIKSWPVLETIISVVSMALILLLNLLL